MAFTKVPNELLVFTAKRLVRASDIAVYVAIASHRNQRTGACFPSMETVAEELAVARQTVWRAVRRLEAAGALVTLNGSTSRGKHATRYLFPYLGQSVSPVQQAQVPPVQRPSTTGGTSGYVPPVVQELEDEVNKDKRGASAKKEQDEPRALTEEEVIPRFGEVTHHHVVSGGFCIRCKEAVS